MAEHVILFAGPMGAGKTAAIASLSEIGVVGTEVANSERHIVDKPTTTVALDYGEIVLGDEDRVRLYGAPGQRRFDFMWRILTERAEGLVLLVNADAADPVATMLEYLDEFAGLDRRGGIVIGVTRSDLAPGVRLADLADALAVDRPDLVVPVFTVDARDAEQMRTVLMTLIASVEMHAMFAEEAIA